MSEPAKVCTIDGKLYQIGDYVQLPAASPAVTQGNQRWHVAQVRTGSERTVEEYLRRFAFEPYTPRARIFKAVPQRYLSRKQRNGALVKRPVVKAVWPGYVFVNFDIDRGNWHQVFQRAGVFGLLCVGDEPTRVVASEVARVRALEVDGYIPSGTFMSELFMASSAYEIGEQVRVTGGPFASFSGIVEELPPDLRELLMTRTLDELDDSVRVRVAVSIFGRSTPVELALSQIEKV